MNGIAGGRFDESFTVYDQPLVMIFQNVGHLTAEEMLSRFESSTPSDALGQAPSRAAFPRKLRVFGKWREGWFVDRLGRLTGATPSAEKATNQV
jgi:hypothetical protein